MKQLACALSTHNNVQQYKFSVGAEIWKIFGVVVVISPRTKPINYWCFVMLLACLFIRLYTQVHSVSLRIQELFMHSVTSRGIYMFYAIFFIRMKNLTAIKSLQCFSFLLSDKYKASKCWNIFPKIWHPCHGFNELSNASQPILQWKFHTSLTAFKIKRDVV